MGSTSDACIIGPLSLSHSLDGHWERKDRIPGLYGSDETKYVYNLFHWITYRSDQIATPHGISCKRHSLRFNRMTRLTIFESRTIWSGSCSKRSASINWRIWNRWWQITESCWSNTTMAARREAFVRRILTVVLQCQYQDMIFISAQCCQLEHKTCKVFISLWDWSEPYIVYCMRHNNHIVLIS